MTFAQIGGARIGLFNATWPFAKLVASPEELILWVVGIKFTFPKGSIVTLSPYSAVFSQGLRIDHRGIRAPRFIVFWSPNLPALSKELSALGYILS